MKANNAFNEDKRRLKDAVMFEYRIVAYVVVAAVVAMTIIFVIMPIMLVPSGACDKESDGQKAIPVSDDCK